MTATVSNKLYTILGHEFDIEELRDIVIFGMRAGVSGFIYSRDCVAKFNENEDTIEEYLSDWYHDNMGENDYIGVIASGADGVIASGIDSKPARPVCSINELKTRMVWCYVELNAHEILCLFDANY